MLFENITNITKHYKQYFVKKGFIIKYWVPSKRNPHSLFFQSVCIPVYYIWLLFSLTISLMTITKEIPSEMSNFLHFDTASGWIIESFKFELCSRKMFMVFNAARLDWKILTVSWNKFGNPPHCTCKITTWYIYILYDWKILC